MTGATIPLPNTPSWRGPQLKKKKRRDNFNFYSETSVQRNWLNRLFSHDNYMNLWKRREKVAGTDIDDSLTVSDLTLTTWQSILPCN
jgi:hypothetical protein